MDKVTLIDKTYTNIKLDEEYFDLYIVRKAILNAVKINIKNFKGDLLDVGCGIMPYRELILQENKTVTSYTGLDFENPIYSEYELIKPDIFWDGKTIPLNGNTIDTIIATELFEHCANPEDLMKEMGRVLKPGGTLFFTVPFLWYLHLTPNDEYRYTPFSLKRHLVNAGYNSINIQSLGGWDASLAQMLTIWLKFRPLAIKKKKILFRILQPVIKKLLKTDNYLADKHDFKDGSMATGFWGTALKNSTGA